MSETNHKKAMSFKDFRSEQPVEEAADAILPVLHEPDEEDDSNIPRLFATIHFKSEHRPDGYSSKDLWELNNAANAHLPHLQQPWPHGDMEEPPEEDDADEQHPQPQ